MDPRSVYPAFSGYFYKTAVIFHEDSRMGQGGEIGRIPASFNCGTIVSRPSEEPEGGEETSG